MKRNLLYTALIMVFFVIQSLGQQMPKIGGAIENTDFASPKAVSCMPGATYSQAPTNPGYGLQSNDYGGYNIFHYIDDYSTTIQSLRFFGFQGIFQNGNIMPLNNEDSLNFIISVYGVQDELLGDIIFTDTLIIPHNSTDVNFLSQYRVFYWDYTPSEEITDLPEEFWISVKNDDEDVWFYWLTQVGGDGHIMQTYEEDTAIVTVRQSLCIVSSDYCSPSGGGGSYIDGIEMGDINNTGSGSNGYEDFTNLSTDVVPGETIQVTVNISELNESNDDLSIWIDFDDSHSFNDEEEELYCKIGQLQQNHTIEVQIPYDAPIGTHRMRIRLKRSNYVCGSPCGDTDYGEVEDYSVNVVEETGILNSENQKSFKVYPNPNNGLFSISVDGEYEMTISNSLGQVVLNEKVSNEHQIDLRDHAKGLYIVTLKSEKEISSQSMIKN